jgi:hypothetical protein
MSGRTGPNIVRNGLIFELDAADKNSYPDAGTLWRNLASSTNNGTLTNGPVYTSANNGAIIFDGLDDQVLISPTISVPSNYTIQAWYWKSSLTSFDPILVDSNSADGFWIETNPSTRLSVYANVGSLNIIGNQILSLNKWYNICLTITNSGSAYTINMYINGVLDKTYTGAGSTTTSFTADSIGGDGVGDVMNGKIACNLAYSRALTQSEILQNYNATKGRFNLQ